MPHPTVSPLLVKAQYSAVAGLILWTDGKSRPVSPDVIEQEFSQHALDRVMESQPAWVTLSAPRPARTFRVTSVVNHVGIELGTLCASGKRAARQAARAAFPNHIVFVVPA